MRAAAHAKVNWWLRVMGRRADGFHEIETLMLPLELHDDVEVELCGEGVRVECSDPGLPRDGENLAGKAARIFSEATGWTGGVNIRIEKRIPAGAGLGGGSSNAAAVLRCLNHLTGAGMSAAALATLAAKAGSDCAWFVESRPRVCRGCGERLGMVESGDWAGRALLLVKPPFGVPTAWAYGRLAELRARGVREGEAPGEAGAPGSPVNDLEEPVFGKFLLLGALKEFLGRCEGVERAMMSGSGSTIYAVLREGAPAEEIAAAVRAAFGETLWAHPTRVAETLASGGGM